MSTSPEPAPDFSRGHPALYLFALLLFFLRFGYGYASGDQDELLPYLIHLQNPDLLAQDWFVQTQTASLSVRAYFVSLLRGLATIMPLWAAVGLLYVGCWPAVAHGIYRLSWAIIPDRIVAVGSVITCLVVWHKWTLGSNDLVYNMLVPEMLSWALALPALRMVIEKRWLVPALLLGMAAWFQLLVGLLVGGLVGLLLIWRLFDESRRASLQALFGFSIVFLVTSLPVVIPIALQQLEASSSTPDSFVFYIIAQFRAPHHYLFSAFSLGVKFRFGLLVVLGGAALWWLHRKEAIQHAQTLFRLLVLILLLCIVYIIGTDVVPTLLIAKFQVFKLAVVAKLLLSILICGGLVYLLPVQLQSRLNTLLMHQKWAFGVVVLLWMATIWTIDSDIGRPARMVHSRVHQESALGRTEQWIREETPPDALFAVPPTLSSFRSNARRAIIVGFVAYPFQDDLMQQWYKRLLDLAPVDTTHSGGAALIPQLDAAYHRQNGMDWMHLQALYEMDYLLVDTSRQAEPLPFRQVHVDEPWVVYEMP